MAKSYSSKKKMKKASRPETIDEFIEAQLHRYIRIHKEHEKEINYIG